MLSENFVESPWCVLELLSAVVHQRPIAFFRVSDTFKLATFRKQLVAIGFPDVDALDKFSVEINYSEDHFDSAMNKIAERVESNKKEYPMSVDVVTRDQVAEKYEKLRETRNEKFPKKRQFPSWEETKGGGLPAFGGPGTLCGPSWQTTAIQRDSRYISMSGLDKTENNNSI